MGEAEAVGTPRDLLLATKLGVPRSRPGRVARPRTGALAAIEEAATVLPEARARRVPLGVRRAEPALAMGDPGVAEDWVRGRGLAPDDEPVYPQDAEYQLLARLLIAEGDPHQAVPMLGRWRALAVAQGRTADVIAVAVLASLAHAANRDDAAAQAALAEALVLAAPEGHLRVFLAEGAPLAAVLRPLLADPRWAAQSACRPGCHGSSSPAWPRRSTGRARPSFRLRDLAQLRCSGWSNH